LCRSRSRLPAEGARPRPEVRRSRRAAVTSTLLIRQARNTRKGIFGRHRAANLAIGDALDRRPSARRPAIIQAVHKEARHEATGTARLFGSGGMARNRRVPRVLAPNDRAVAERPDDRELDAPQPRPRRNPLLSDGPDQPLERQAADASLAL